MTDLAIIRALRERVAALKGLDREVDRLLWLTFPDELSDVLRPEKRPSITGSVDESIAFVERVLQGWGVVLTISLSGEAAADVFASSGECYSVAGLEQDAGGNRPEFKTAIIRPRHAPTAPLAIILAALSALEAQVKP